MNSCNFLLVYTLLLSGAPFFGPAPFFVLCDGDHAHDAGHDHGHVTTVHTTGPNGESSTTSSGTSTSGGPGGLGAGGIAGILSSLSPELIASLSQNPAVSSYLRNSGIDLGSATASKAAAEAGGSTPPPTGGSGGAYNYPPPPGGLGGFPGGFGGGLPFLGGFGPYKNLQVSGDFGVGPEILVKKVIIFVGGGILILVFLALLSKGFAKGGIFNGFGSSLSEAFSGAADLDLGPIHKSAAGAGAVNAGFGGQGRPLGGVMQPSPQLTQRVYNGIDRQF